MKKTYLILLFLLMFLTQGFAQIENCGTITPSKEKAKEIERIVNLYRGISSSSITYLPVKLHLTRSYGTSYYDLNSFMYEFAKMNEKFLPVGFQFYLCDSINYLNNSILDDFDANVNYSDSLELVAQNVDDAINIYYVNNSNSGGRSNFISGDKFDNWMFVVNRVWQGGETLTHEMGHYFNLYHTHESFQGAELVNGSNCNASGDYVCDTPADTYPTYYNVVTCNYNGTAKDGNNQSYAPLTNNIMSYYSGGCRMDFTAGQAARAQSSHAARLSLIENEGNQYGFTYPSNDTISVFNVRVFELYGSVRVRWYCNSNPLGFLIERSTNPSSGFVSIGGVYSFSREFIDASVVAGTTYYYRIKAANSKNYYSSIVAHTASFNSYSTPASYYPDNHDVRYLYLYNPQNVSQFYVSFPRNSEPYLDYSQTLRSFDAGTKYGVYWLDYYENSSNRDSFKVWIDLNQNHIFENSEIVSKGYNNNGRSSDSLIVPVNTTTDFYRMRFRTSYLYDSFGAEDRQRYSDTKDITVYIEGDCANGLQLIDYVFTDFIANGPIETVDYTQNYYDPFFPEYQYPANLTSPSITLGPGFSADGGSPFLAEAGGCP
ncbi:GEVED domain-containing protein [uncultured Arcticibacterium sp.]|uniref:GEVED domain-containing protein n=1 Tax=uncultured Arcticibacterium sp. TaxID=2173042 RepID=UPI0030F9EE09